MEEFKSHFDSRINVVEKSIEFVEDGNPQETSKCLTSISVILAKNNRKASILRSRIVEWKELLNQVEFVRRNIENLKTSMDILSSPNSPLPKDMLIEQDVKTDNNRESSDNQPSKSNKNAGVKTVIPSLTSLILPEYDRIPTYMKGRITYEGINKAIGEFNEHLHKKYDFYLQGFKPHASLQDKKRYQEMKKLENKDCKGIYFLVLDDLKGAQSFKTEASRRTFFTILRHFKKIREIRGPGSIVRYGVIEMNNV